MTSVIAFVITDWLRCKANCQALRGWMIRRVVLSICMSAIEIRYILLFYKKKTPVYTVEEELMTLEYSNIEPCELAPSPFIATY